MPQISIIVPVYKVEQYLHKCLDSILAQTFTDWECILIDDGSPDNSGKICDEYAQKDSRFRVIHQENAGVSAARNAGLNAALGEWIGFVDSDDWIEPETYETALNAANKYCADIIQWGFFLNDGDVDYNSIQYDEKEIYTPIMNSLWASLIKKKLFLEHEIILPVDIKVAEDMFVMAKLMYFSTKTYIISDVFYHYYEHLDSAYHNIKLDNLEDEYKVVNRLESFLQNHNAKKLWFDWLIERKIFLKNKYIFVLEKPDFHSWRCKFNEVFCYLLKTSPLRQKIFYFFIQYHMDFFAYIMFKIRFKMNSHNGKIKLKNTSRS